MELKVKVVILIAFIGALVALAGVFMPWMTSGPLSISGWEFITDDGEAAASVFALIALISVILALVFTVLDLLNVKITEPVLIYMFLMVQGIVIAVMVFMSVYDQFLAIENLGYSTENISYGFGAIVSIIGGVLVAVAGVISIIGAIKK